ncbi:Fusaric acid resistance protein-like [Parafrankia irregularis]|uniref:Fusaric acid resistance protein-like n=1 Tax=Parafrankia irregularis TaxID=795642 RepID=A0A0S4R1W6_9ACTN|nr:MULTISPECIES: FUSC family protein [Parafrankia]MBE3201092.1 FUSC family protein [Parafrankia sp. CH37]CUU61196.1 Fusaric acid resistance protein-like [Parafrankia irregularis]
MFYVLRNIWRRVGGTEGLDPGLVELRSAVLSMAAVLAGLGCATALRGAAGLHAQAVVATVALTVLLWRGERSAASRHRPVALLVVPLFAMGAGEVGRLMSTAPPVGDALYVLMTGVAVWVRRFGPLAARFGALVLPTSLLVLIVAVPAGPGVDPLGWFAATAFIAIAVTHLCLLFGEGTGVLPRRARVAARPAAGVPPHRRPRVHERARAYGRGRAGRPRGWRLAPTTRMAVQLTLALAAAFALGRLVYPQHWPWVVISTYIVCSGTRARGDVLHKAVARVVGGAAGTVLVAACAGLLPAGGTGALVALFVVLGIATWLRPLHYALWAAGVTAMLALLYDYQGTGGPEELVERLGGILLGAALAGVVSWFVLPLRTRDVVRVRTARSLAALAGVVAAGRSAPELVPELLTRRRDSFERTLRDLLDVAPPVEAHRALGRLADRIPAQAVHDLVTWPTGVEAGADAGRHQAHAADTIDALVRCQAPVRALTELGCAHPQALADPAVRRGLEQLEQHVAAACR